MKKKVKSEIPGESVVILLYAKINERCYLDLIVNAWAVLKAEI